MFLGWQPPSLLSGKDPCQFLQVHARKGKPGFHLHPRLPYVLCITESVLFFRSPEDPLYGLLPPGIDIPVPTGMADIFHCLHTSFPYMPGDCLDMALAVGASLKARTVGAVGPTTLILPIPRPVVVRYVRMCSSGQI